MADMTQTIADEITMIRKLLVFALVNSGVSQEKVAGALGVSQATISRLSGGATLKSGRNGKMKKGPRR